MYRPSRSNCAGFSLVEMLVVIGIICMLMGMVIGVQRYALGKSSRSRAEAEVAALSAAAEAYKADQVTYPRSGDTDVVSSVGNKEMDSYMKANVALYIMLSGDTDLNGRPDSQDGIANAAPVYFGFKSSMLRMNGSAVQYIRDPWDNASAPRPYGYSTMRAAALQNGSDSPRAGHNITFDLWSTGNNPANESAWITNW